jgi:hypothetical protein
LPCHLLISTDDTYDFRMRIVAHLTRFEMIQNSIRSSRMLLAQWTAPISHVTHQPLIVPPHETAKAVSLKIALHAALSTSVSNMFSVGGRGQHLMQQCIRMPVLQTCLFLGANSILLMQALALVMLFLFHIGVSVTICKSGDVPHFGMDPNSLA